VEKVARTNPNVVAVFLETIQGEGGINPTRWTNTCRACATSATSRAGC
jgi:acetylornithine/succinyldiaminopimelate/putrescine aminotransferase